MCRSHLSWAEGIWPKLEAKLSAETDRMGGKIPYHAENGVYRMDWGKQMPEFWTNGFWGGIMWQMYQITGDEKYKEKARNVAGIINPLLLKADKLHHDVGFMWLATSVADYKITGDTNAKAYALHAATLLAGRYNPDGEFIRAWNMEGRENWAIIDTMMNISLLFWATKETKDVRFYQIATHHADKTLKFHLRPDGSVYHIVAYQPTEGDVEEYPQGQGYEPNSSWSRGQAWFIYGFINAWKNTGDDRYLQASKQAAHYFLANAALTDWKILSDFRAPKEPVVWDSTAAACAACGLLELAKAVSEYEASLYESGAMKLLEALDKEFCNWDPLYDSIVQKGTGSYHDQRFSYQVPIIYGDYFFMEAILKLLGKDVGIW